MIDLFKKWFSWNRYQKPNMNAALCFEPCSCEVNVEEEIKNDRKEKIKRPLTEVWRRKKLKREAELADVKDQLMMIKIQTIHDVKTPTCRSLSINGYIVRKARKGYNVGLKGKQVKKFLLQCCEYDKRSVTRLKDLYVRYLDWAKNKKIKLVSLMGLGRFLAPNRVVAIQMKSAGVDFRCYRGIKIRPIVTHSEPEKTKGEKDEPRA